MCISMSMSICLYMSMLGAGAIARALLQPPGGTFIHQKSYLF